jgi:competence protein ComEC
MKWIIVKVPGEGDCFFYVLGLGLENLRSYDIHSAYHSMRKIRREIASYILATVYDLELEALRDLIGPYASKIQRVMEEKDVDLPTAAGIVDLFAEPLPVDSEEAKAILNLYDYEQPQRGKVDGGGCPLWQFAYWLQWTRDEINKKPIAQKAWAEKNLPTTWKPFLRHTLWGDTGFVGHIAKQLYGKGCVAVHVKPDDDWESPENIVFLYKDNHFNLLLRVPEDEALRVESYKDKDVSDQRKKLLKRTRSRALLLRAANNITDRVKGSADGTEVCDDVAGDVAREMDISDEDPQRSMSIHFLDVGMGDGTLIECPDGTTILVDLGSLMNSDIAGRDAITFLVTRLAELRRQRGLDRPTIDRLYLSHADSDHINRIQKLQTRVLNEGGAGELDIKKIFIGGQATAYKDPGIKKLFKRVKPEPPFPKDHHENTLAFVDGDGEVGICVLSANVDKGGKKGGATQKNMNSLVLAISYKGRFGILMADAETEVENAILGAYKELLEDNPGLLRCDFLKMGHHASEHGSSRAFIDVTRPERIFASADMRFTHPVGTAVSRASRYVVDDFSHSYLTGARTNNDSYNQDYTQHESRASVYTTMGSMKPDPDGEETERKKVDQKVKRAKKEDKQLRYKKDFEEYDGSFVEVQGVQHELVIFEDGSIQVFNSQGQEGDIFLLPTEEPDPSDLRDSR